MCSCESLHSAYACVCVHVCVCVCVCVQVQCTCVQVNQNVCVCVHAMLCVKSYCSRAGSDSFDGVTAHCLPQGAVVQVKAAQSHSVGWLDVGVEGLVVEYTPQLGVGVLWDGQGGAGLLIWLELRVQVSTIIFLVQKG